MATWKTRNCPLASLAGQASGCIDDRSIGQLGFSEGKALLKLVCRSSRQAEEEPRGRPGSLAVLLAPPWPPCSLPSLSRALLKVSILTALKDTVPNMPGLKWIFNPVLAKGEHAVKLTPEVMGCLEMPLSFPSFGFLPLGLWVSSCSARKNQNALRMMTLTLSQMSKIPLMMSSWTPSLSRRCLRWPPGGAPS